MSSFFKKVNDSIDDLNRKLREVRASLEPPKKMPDGALEMFYSAFLQIGIHIKETEGPTTHERIFHFHFRASFDEVKKSQIFTDKNTGMYYAVPFCEKENCWRIVFSDDLFYMTRLACIYSKFMEAALRWAPVDEEEVEHKNMKFTTNIDLYT